MLVGVNAIRIILFKTTMNYIMNRFKLSLVFRGHLGTIVKIDFRHSIESTSDIGREKSPGNTGILFCHPQEWNKDAAS